MPEPQDSIMDMANNLEDLYNDTVRMFDRWVEEGDGWDENYAEKEAENLAAHFAEAIESMPGEEGTYSRKSISEAAEEMIEEFESYREDAIKAAVKEIQRRPPPENIPMTPGDIKHAEKYEKIAQRIGIDNLIELMPVSSEKIRKALIRGDKHLNSIALRKWDAAAALITRTRLSLAEKVSTLKHVATWHYA